MKILEISKKFQGNFIKHNNECIHIHRDPRPEIYENFGNFKEISGKFWRNFREMSSNTIMNVYISILTLGLKYMKIFEISGKSSNTIMNVYISILTLGLKYMKILEISLKVLKLSHLRISEAWVYMYMIIVLIDYFLKFLKFSRLRIPGVWVDM